MNHSTRPSRRPLAVGFTLLEVLVVVVILAIMATITVPRLTGQERRVTQLVVEQLADLLTMFAQHDALSQKPVGILHDAKRNWIVLMVLEIDENDPEEPADWRPDPFVAPVKLPPNIDPMNVSARENGDVVDFQQWPIASTPGKERPSIEISFQTNDGQVKTLVLTSNAMAPYAPSDEESLASSRNPIDLDEAGRAREDW